MASKVDSSGLSVTSDGKSSARKPQDNDDYESIYSNQKIRSAYGGGQKKKHPLLLGPSRQNQGKMLSLRAASKNNLSEFTQRIMSAKLLRTKQVQNQLNETQNQLNELINENRVLRNMLKRQEGALKKYEGNHAELPQLIRSHNEEIRALKANNKLIKAQLRESNAKLKDRENELETLRDNYNKLKKLSTEKNLLEREKLQKKVEDLQEVIKEQEEKIQVLSRKVLLESKNYRHHLNVEVMKHKETQKDLSSALNMINKLERELLAKDKQVPGGKVLLKRESKNLVPVIFSKSTDMQPKLGASEDSFLSRLDPNRKSSLQDSEETELEILNGLGSSDDTSPIQDIFPEINGSKKPSPEVKTTTEITFSKSEMFTTNNDVSTRLHNTLKPRKNSLPKTTSRFTKDPELNARAMVDSLKEDMETISTLTQKVQENTALLEEKDPDNAFLEELKISTRQLELNNNLLPPGLEKEEESSFSVIKQEIKRNVPKRKLEDEKEVHKSHEKPLSFDEVDELTKTQQEKLENMTKTWNDMKSKIQEERKKAEEKMKELPEFGGDADSDKASSELESDNIEELPPKSIQKIEEVKELKFVNFTDDAYILQELEKTDKIFNKLKNGTRKQAQKTSSPSPSSTEKQPKANTTPTPKPKPKQPPDIKSFRTESRRDPKYLEDFQSEYQKQNLLKALKAIDVGRDPNLSTDESDGSESKKEKPSRQKNGLKRIKQLSAESDKSLMAELFGSKHRLGKSENLKLEYGTVANE